MELDQLIESLDVANKTPFRLERLLVLSKLQISEQLNLSPSHLQSLGATWGALGLLSKRENTVEVLIAPNCDYFGCWS